MLRCRAFGPINVLLGLTARLSSIGEASIGEACKDDDEQFLKDCMEHEHCSKAGYTDCKSAEMLCDNWNVGDYMNIMCRATCGACPKSLDGQGLNATASAASGASATSKDANVAPALPSTSKESPLIENPIVIAVSAVVIIAAGILAGMGLHMVRSSCNKQSPVCRAKPGEDPEKAVTSSIIMSSYDLESLDTSDSQTLEDVEEDEIRPSRTYSSLESTKRPYVEIEACDEKTFWASVNAELARWSNDTLALGRGSAIGVMQCAFELISRASDGALLLVAPISELRRLGTQSTDSGHMTRTLRRFSIFTREFQDRFLDFTTHTENDRWPENHDDVGARGLPKDGAFLMLPSGMPAKCAAKIVGLPSAPRQWPGCGTRHETALAVSAFLNKAVIFIRSSSGHLHVLLARDRGHLVLQPKWLNHSFSTLPTTAPSSAEESETLTPASTMTAVDSDQSSSTNV